VEGRRQKAEGWEESFLSAQADAFAPQNYPGRKQRAGAKAEEKSACSVRNDGVTLVCVARK